MSASEIIIKVGILTLTTTMARKDDNCNTAYITQDLLLQILICLPAKSLLRFKSVCKSWSHLFGTSDFMIRHHRRQSQDRLLMYGGGDQNSESPLPPLKFSLLSDHHSFCSEIDLSLPGFSPNTCFDNLSMLHLDGVICLYYHDRKYTKDPTNHKLIHTVHIYLWNPATRRIRALPQPNVHLPNVSDTGYGAPDVGVGFGFDAFTNSYKVVRLAVEDWWFSGIVEYKVHVYSLGTDCWKTLYLKLGVEAIISSIKEPLKGGRIYCWSGRKLATEFDQGSHLLLWFDFCDHDIGTIPFPDRISYLPNPELTIIRDNVASVNDMGTGQLEVWMLKVFGVKESWTCLYRVSPFWEQTVSVFNDGESFLVVSNRRLSIYNNASQRQMSIPFDKDLSGAVILNSVRYKESLVSIERGHDILPMVGKRKRYKVYKYY